MKNGEKFKTAEERAAAFGNWCYHQKRETNNCKDCDECHFAWLEREEDQEKPLPCPCCGNVEMAKFDDICNPKTFIFCPSCGYRSPWEMNIDVAIARHNELCRKWGTSKPSEDQA